MFSSCFTVRTDRVLLMDSEDERVRAGEAVCRKVVISAMRGSDSDSDRATLRWNSLGVPWVLRPHPSGNWSEASRQ
jgi:hypothetical protein